METLQKLYDSLDISYWFQSNKKSLEITDSTLEFSFVESKLNKVLYSFVRLMLPEGEHYRVEVTDKETRLDYKLRTLYVSTSTLNAPLRFKDRINAFFGQFIRGSAYLKYSDLKYSHSSELEQRIFNILEDRRIEHLMCEHYPGYRTLLESHRKVLTASLLLYDFAEIKYDVTDVSKVYLIFNRCLELYISISVLYPEVLLRKPDLEERLITEISSHLEEDEVWNLVELLSHRESTFEGILKQTEKLLSFFDLTNCPEFESSCSGFSVDVKRNGANKEVSKEEATVLRKLSSTLLHTSSTKELKVAVSDAAYSSGISTEVDKTFKTKLDNDYEKVSYRVPTAVGTVYQQYLEFKRKLSLTFSTFASIRNLESTIYEQSEGDLDEDSLYEVPFNRNVFTSTESASGIGLEVILLVDLSASMAGENINKQKILSAAICEAMLETDFIDFKMYGHTANSQGSNSLELFTFVDKGVRYKKEVIFGMTPEYNNADGYALQQIFSKFSKQENTKKLVIMLSDGDPCATFYSGFYAREHVKSVVSKGLRQGIRVLSVALDNFNQEDMYTDIIPFSGSPTALEISKWIRRYFTSEARTVTY